MLFGWELLVGLLAVARGYAPAERHGMQSDPQSQQENCQPANADEPVGAQVPADGGPCFQRWQRHRATGVWHVMGGYREGNCTLPPAPPTRFHHGIFAGHERRVIFVHVGKSAGTSLKTMLQSAPINFTHIHVQNAGDAIDIAMRDRLFDLLTDGEQRKTPDTWIIVTRDPLLRTISAFNWRHPSGGGLPCQRLPTTAGEARMYSCFPQLRGAANAFAESLSSCVLALIPAPHTLANPCLLVTPTLSTYLPLVPSAHHAADPPHT